MNDELLPLKLLSASVFVGTETEGWDLDEQAYSEDPPRIFSVDVVFSAPFATPPVVHIGLTGFDIDKCSSSRIRISAKKITAEGFQADISTWNSSRVYSAEFQWMAIGS